MLVVYHVPYNGHTLEYAELDQDAVLRGSSLLRELKVQSTRMNCKNERGLDDPEENGCEYQQSHYLEMYSIRLSEVKNISRYQVCADVKTET